MSPDAMFVCLLAAFVAFTVAAVRSWPGLNLVAVGLALWVLVPLWDAVKAL